MGSVLWEERGVSTKSFPSPSGSSREQTSTSMVPGVSIVRSCAPQGSSSHQMPCTGAEVDPPPNTQGRSFLLCAEMLRLSTEPSHSSLLSFA